jgi:hypothetical protein
MITATRGIETPDDSKNNALSNNAIVGINGTTTAYLGEPEKDQEE